MNGHLEEALDFRWGIERETHRVLPDGNLSSAPHPDTLRAPSFTKDFAESQLELVTKPRASIEGAVGELEGLTATARGAIGNGLLWPFSMPPLFHDGETIRVARMGDGEAARLAEKYRAGLSARYGVARQLICGVHVNVSFGDALLGELRKFSPLTPEEGGQGSERDGYYLRLARNLFDDMPSLAMLFGSTPFDANAREGDAAKGYDGAEEGSRGAAFAYSVRNSPRGYARTEYRRFLNLDSIAGHVAGIKRGLSTESAEFRKLGLLRNGRPVQLNARVFQKEKEFYAPIRFKRTPAAGETALAALERRGVEYVELRFFDVDPFSPAGVSADAMRLAHLFVLDALAKPSARKTGAALGDTLALADDAALSDPFAGVSRNAHLARLLRRLDSLAPLAVNTGAGYGRALDSYRARLARPGGSSATRVALGYLESGLDWNRYGAALARALERGEVYDVPA